MNGRFLFGYLFFGAVLGGVAWYGAPELGARMDPQTRDKIRELFGMPALAAPAQTAPSEPEAAPEPDRAAARNDAGAAPDAAPTATAQPEAESESAAAAAETAAEKTPAQLGIRQTDARSAAWAVLKQITPAEHLDDSAYGNVAGGRFFLIKGRKTRDRAIYLIGNFTPKNLPEDVQIPADCVHCFTGDPMKLSAKQQESLRMYYQLRGEAEEFVQQKKRAYLERTPQFRAAAAAVKAFREKAKQVEKNQRAASDDNRSATYELTQLRDKMRIKNQEYKEWKAKNESKIPDPRRSKAYRAIIERQREYAAPIEGMAF